MNDNWIEIVETLLQYVKCNSKEHKYQQEIENCLKFLGWRTSNKTMQSQLTLGFGSGNKLRPDIILYKNGMPVLPIEIKRPDNVCNEKQIGQLGNYMRQLKSNVGLYFGENIRFYYDNPDDLDNPICVFKVELSKDEPNGEMFCEMMSYEKFDVNKLEKFCEEYYNQIISHNSLQLRLDEFLSIDKASMNVIDLIKDKFVKEGFDENILEDELNKLVCRIEWKHNCLTPHIKNEFENTVTSISASENNETEFSLDGNRYWGVGRFVLAVVKQYVSEHPHVTLEELEEMFPSSLSCNRKCGVLRTMDFVKYRKDEGRFFTKEPMELKDGTIVVVYSQWGNSGLLKRHFQRFLEHIKKIYHVYSR